MATRHLEIQMTALFFFLLRDEDALVACIYTSSTFFMLGYLEVTAVEG